MIEPILRIVVGWLRSPFVREIEVVEEFTDVTPSQLGIRFQKAQFERLFDNVKDWPSVEFLDAFGDPITSLSDISAGPDGGIDAVIRITTRTEKGAKIVSTRIRNLIVSRSY